MTEEQQKELEQMFEAMGKSGGRFIIGQVIGTQNNKIIKSSVASKDDNGGNIRVAPDSPKTHEDEGNDDALAVVRKCFKFTSEFTKGKVEAVMNENYHGSHAELALIEVALYDHGQLKRRNAHTAFIRALVAWGLIKIANEDELEQIRKGMTDKFRRIPKDGYKAWRDELLDDSITCDNIGKQLGDTMPYIR